MYASTHSYILYTCSQSPAPCRMTPHPQPHSLQLDNQPTFIDIWVLGVVVGRKEGLCESRQDIRRCGVTQQDLHERQNSELLGITSLMSNHPTHHFICWGIKRTAHLKTNCMSLREKIVLSPVVFMYQWFSQTRLKFSLPYMCCFIFFFFFNVKQEKSENVIK